MPELDPTWQQTMSIWWLIFWRTMVGSVLIGAGIGVVVGIFAFASGVSVASFNQPIAALSVVAALIWAIVVIRMALRKTYRGFRIALVPRSN